MPGRRLTDEETTPINFRIESSLFDKLKAVAKENDRTVPDMARVFIKQALRNIPASTSNPTVATPTPNSGATATAPVASVNGSNATAEPAKTSAKA